MESPAELPVIRTQTVSAARGEAGARYSGVVRPDKQVQLDFKAAGYVRRVARAKATPVRLIQEGDHVRAGDVLASVDTADYAAKLDEARAAANEARAAEAQAERDRARSQRLVDEGARPRAELEVYQAQLDVSRARRARAEAVVREAELALSDCALRAPLSGVVLSRTVEEGALVTPRTPGFVLADTTLVKVGFGVPEEVASTLEVGDLTSVEIPASSRKLSAKITRIAPAADAKSRLFDVEVSLDNADGGIKPGAVATVLLQEQRALEGSARVALSSLVRGPTEAARTAVFVLDSNEQPVVRLRPVEVFGVSGNFALVRGVKEGDRVATLGAPLLHDNARVRVLP